MYPLASETHSPWGLILVRGPIPRKLIYSGVRGFIFWAPHKVVPVEAGIGVKRRTGASSQIPLTCAAWSQKASGARSLFMASTAQTAQRYARSCSANVMTQTTSCTTALRVCGDSTP